MNKISAARLRTLTHPGRYSDGGGLYFQVRDAGHRSWLFRFAQHHKAHWMGLGSWPDVTLAHARDMARQARLLLLDGRNPLDDRKIAREASRAAETAVTFKEAADRYVEAHKTTWRNPAHAKQWLGTLDAIANPVFGNQPVKLVSTDHVLCALQPVWQTTPVTAMQTRGRIESVLDYARAQGWRTGENPARWRNHLAITLPARNRVQRVEHHAAFPYSEVPAVMAELRELTDTMGGLALQFTILTAAHMGEAIGATWDEIDMGKAAWNIAAERMKAHKPHRVPLTLAALEILDQVRPATLAGINYARPIGSRYVFPGMKAGKPLSNTTMPAVLRRLARGNLTVHRIRSTFRDWAAETTAFPRAVPEAALAHTLRDKAEAAYRGGDLFKRRRALMEKWAEWCLR